MPGKYSHSVVLAGYSSRGIISLSNDKRLESLKSSSTPQPADDAPPPVPIRAKERPISTTRTNPTSPQPAAYHSKRRSRNVFGYESPIGFTHVPGQAGRKVNDHRRDENPRRANPVNDGQDSQPRSPIVKDQFQRPPKYRLSGFDPYAEDADFVPWRELRSRPSENNEQQGADTSSPVQRTIASIAHKHEPRLEVKEWRHGLASKSPEFRTRTRDRSEPLLSVQQFLDLSPPIDPSNSLAESKGSQSPQSPHSSRNHRALLLPPFRPQSKPCSPQKRDSVPVFDRAPVQPKPTRPPPQTMNSNDSFNRGDTSFIDSSDDDEDAEEHPVHEVPQKHEATRRTQSISSARKNNRPRNGAVVDPTEDLPELPGDSAPQVSNVAGTSSRPESKSQKRFSNLFSMYGYDSDDSDDLPLQRQSPLLRISSHSRSLRRTGDLRRYLSEMPDEHQLSPPPQTLGRSPESMTRGTTASTVDPEPDFSGFSDRDESEDYLNNSSTVGLVHANRTCYYRAIDDDITRRETRPSMSHAASGSSVDRSRRPSHSSIGDVSVPPLPVLSHRRPSSSSVRDVQQHQQPLASPAIQDAKLGMQIGRILSRTEDLRPTSSLPQGGSVNPMPRFGTPSVVRDSEEKARLNVQNLSRSNTPLPTPIERGRSSPQTFLQHQRQRLRSSSDVARTRKNTGASILEQTRKARPTPTPTPSTPRAEEKWESPGIGIRTTSLSSAADFGEEGWGRMSIEPFRKKSLNGSVVPQSERVDVAAPAPATIYADDDFDHEQQRPEIGHDKEQIVGAGLSEDEDDDAALPPPDISRRRQLGNNDQGTTRPDVSRSTSRVGGRAGGQGKGIDRLESLVRDQHELAQTTQTQKKRARAKSVFGRLLRQ
ncbi:hypothetical protein LTR92_005610 [Exophiala xenobiotica]|nr:hypothetical protein LTR92_005610 [Exophiala xenobiotica]KAK5557290.1 hypothetical protein LTR46_004316 [Exophiala xenobiotica]